MSPLSPATTKRRRSIKTRTMSRAQQSTQQAEMRSTAATVKKEKPLSKNQREKLAEMILAKKISLRQDQRVPSTRHRGVSTHQTMLNAIGYRSFGTSIAQQSKRRREFNSVLPSFSVLKALRAGSSTHEKLDTVQAGSKGGKDDHPGLYQRVD